MNKMAEAPIAKTVTLFEPNNNPFDKTENNQ